MTQSPSSLGARDVASYFHPYTNLKTAHETGPTIINGGNGVEVYDEDDRTYFEALAVSSAPHSASTMTDW